MKKFAEFIVMGIILFFGIALVITICGSIVMMSWNGVMPHAFGLPKLKIFHGVSLFFLAGTLFGVWASANKRE